MVLTFKIRQIKGCKDPIKKKGYKDKLLNINFLKISTHSVYLKLKNIKILNMCIATVNRLVSSGFQLAQLVKSLMVV